MKTNYEDSNNIPIVWCNSQLICTGHYCKKIPKKLIKLYGHLAKKLDLSFNSLKLLDGLESFVYIEELILDNNQLDENVEFPFNQNLNTLSINKNKIKSLEKFLNKLQKSYPNLKYLSLLGNAACPDQLTRSDVSEEDYKRYKYYVVYKLPKLNFLDFSMITLDDRKEASRVGPYMKVIRPDEDQLKNDCTEEDSDFDYTPLPITNNLEAPSHRGAFGRLRYKYTGKHSEGNRFIRNNQL